MYKQIHTNLLSYHASCICLFDSCSIGFHDSIRWAGGFLSALAMYVRRHKEVGSASGPASWPLRPCLKQASGLWPQMTGSCHRCWGKWFCFSWLLPHHHHQPHHSPPTLPCSPCCASPFYPPLLWQNLLFIYSATIWHNFFGLPLPPPLPMCCHQL